MEPTHKVFRCEQSGQICPTFKQQGSVICVGGSSQVVGAAHPIENENVERAIHWTRTTHTNFGKKVGIHKL